MREERGFLVGWGLLGGEPLQGDGQGPFSLARCVRISSTVGVRSLPHLRDSVSSAACALELFQADMQSALRTPARTASWAAEDAPRC